MKRLLRIGILFFLIQSLAGYTAPRAQAQSSISFQVFYDELSPYGSWIDNPDYGYVWVPDVEYGFSPYHTNGYWVFTDEGWTWFSNYPWGWASFHYGRWYNDQQYGPIWVPGYEWGPGWVTWRRSEGYYGWAPIGPGISFDFAYSNGYNSPYTDWTFVHDRDFGRSDINNYFISINISSNIYTQSVYIDNFRSDDRTHIRYNAGPERREVEQHSGRTYNPVTLTSDNDRRQRVDNKQFRVFRPDVQKNTMEGHRIAPAVVKEIGNVKPARERMNPTNDEHRNNQAPRRENTPVINNAPVREQPERTTQPVRPETRNPVRQQPERTTQPVRPETRNPVRQQPERTTQPAKPETRTPVRNKPPERVQTPRRETPVNNPVRQQPEKKIQPIRTAPQNPVRKMPPEKVQTPRKNIPATIPVRNQPVRQTPVVREQKPQQKPQQKQKNNLRKKD